jgi:hypothetical protein
MFGERHYVSVLRIKRAERLALQRLHPAVKPLLTPLVECPARILGQAPSNDSIGARLERLAQETTSGWAHRRMFCDFSRLASGSVHPLELFGAFCGNSDVTLGSCA